MIDIKFVKESLRWSEMSYDEKAAKYFDIPGYRNGTYRDTKQKYREVYEDIDKIKHGEHVIISKL